MADTRPMLRPELRFFYQEAGGVLIEDPLGGAFLETDRDTAALARLLNGKRTVEEAYRRLREERPGSALAQSEIEPALLELHRHGLLCGEPSWPPPGSSRRGRIGPISQRLRLGAWDAFFSACAAHMKWLHGPVGGIVWLALMAVALAALVAEWTAFTHEIGALFSMDLVLLLWLAWVVSKAWHEFQHGVVARLHGVEIREVGLLFVLFLPLGAYVDVTGAWRLESRWKRLHITAAGIIGELALGAVALLLWTRAPDGDWRSFLHALVLATLVSSILFNANPLMRYDGYYALGDFLGIPNLYQRGLMATRSVTICLLTGLRTAEPEHTLVTVYGWLAQLWRVTIAITLSVVAAHLAFGFGVVLAFLVVWLMLALPLGRLATAIWKLGGAARRTAAIRLGAASTVLLALWFVPFPTWISAPGVVDFKDSRQLRAASSGAVRLVSVDEGSQVETGQPIVSLANFQLEAEQRKLAALVAKAELQWAEAQSRGAPSSLETSRQALATVLQEMAEVQRQIDGLALNAPNDGVVFGQDLQALRGSWVSRGDLIGEIAASTRLEVKVLLGLPAVGVYRRMGHIECVLSRLK